MDPHELRFHKEQKEVVQGKSAEFNAAKMGRQAGASGCQALQLAQSDVSAAGPLAELRACNAEKSALLAAAEERLSRLEALHSIAQARSHEIHMLCNLFPFKSSVKPTRDPSFHVWNTKSCACVYQSLTVEFWDDLCRRRPCAQKSRWRR